LEQPIIQLLLGQRKTPNTPGEEDLSGPGARGVSDRFFAADGLRKTMFVLIDVAATPPTASFFNCVDLC
jgi:hypothetical protein